MRHVKSELLHVRAVGRSILVWKERCAETKAVIAVRRLDRLEREQDEHDDKECEASRKEALSDQTKVAKLVVDKWFVDKGFGFGKVPVGEIVFIHASVVHGGEVLMIGTDAWIQVVNDEASCRGRNIEHGTLGDETLGRRRRTQKKANRVAQQVRHAAALTAEQAAQSEKRKLRWCAITRRDFATSLLGTLRRRTWGAGGSHPQAENDATLIVRQPASSNTQQRVLDATTAERHEV